MNEVMFYIRPNVKHDVAKKFYLVNTTAHHLGQYISLINLLANGLLPIHIVAKATSDTKKCVLGSDHLFPDQLRR